MPKDDEWTALSDYLGGIDGAGTKMKSTSGWSENGNGTNESGFSGLPGGHRYSFGYFDYVGYYGCWWSASEDNAYDAYSRHLYDSIGHLGSYGGLYRDNYGGKKGGLSVRCLRD